MLIAGLGNPTNEYKNTRHNVGSMFLDWLGGNEPWEDKSNLEVLYRKLSFISQTDRIVVDCIKPQTFMNESGKAISKYINYYKINKENLILVFDDLDLDLGNWKVQRAKGPKVHNGVLSVENSLGTKNFIRIRIGVFNNATRTLENNEKISGADYVLMPFQKEELDILYSNIFPKIKESLSLINLS